MAHYEGSGDEGATPTAIISSSTTTMATESSLLKPTQTYFADEKIPIPESQSVSNFKNFLQRCEIFRHYFYGF